ncbi:unnamed protein product [Cladocopium goreaui]|uniref:Uncharacterized protein n=1 Tax=Cladocopium goreaui TaxID=2562237 RepID=A0A9P1BIK4_9DINO|nr:unnamed protein product [Cladocopium goreaui]
MLFNLHLSRSSSLSQALRDACALPLEDIEDMIQQWNSAAMLEEILGQYGMRFKKRQVVMALYQLGLCRQHDNKQGNLQADKVQWALAALEEVETHPCAHQYAFQLGQRAKKRYMDFSPSHSLFG